MSWVSDGLGANLSGPGPCDSALRCYNVSMSRIDNGTTGEVLAQLKDQYSQRERESETRHRGEVKDLRENQRTELDKVKTEAQKRIDEIQDESNLKLSQKDLDHQKEIESIKSIYTKRLAETRKPTDSSS